MTEYINELEKRCDELQQKIQSMLSVHNHVNFEITTLTRNGGIARVEFAYRIKQMSSRLVVLAAVAVEFDVWEIDEMVPQNNNAGVFPKLKKINCTVSELKEKIIEKLGWKYFDINEYIKEDYERCLDDIVGVQPMMNNTQKTDFMKFTMPYITGKKVK